MLALLLTPSAVAGLNDMTTSSGTPMTIPVMTMVAGVVAIVVSKLQAEKQAARFGLESGDTGTKALTWVFRAGGVGMIGYGAFQVLL